VNLHFDYILTHEGLENAWGSKLPRASDKGYPGIYDKACYWVLYEDNLPIAYTSSLRMSSDYAFVGNTYVRRGWRGKGLHTLLLEYRNNAPHMQNISKVTVINPIEDTQMQNLVKVVTKLGYTKVSTAEDIQDLMPDWLYESIVLEGQQIWRNDIKSDR
tara:strand:+ start:13184 stop:13660 length:477 start_codon:yes stop_codon:yes gene_type:complete